MSNRQLKKAIYAYKQGARYSVDPQTAGTELERIQRMNGVTAPGAVVEASRPEDAPLHPVFEWRDAIAAENYRQWQARKLIKSVTVVQHEDGKEVQRPVYVHVPASTIKEDAEAATAKQPLQAGYQPVSVVVQRPDMYALALAELSRKFNSARESMDTLRRAAEKNPETDQERMARIAIAIEAMQTASAAVSALH